MASLEESNLFDPRTFFHGQPCPRCQARRLDRRNFRNISCREGESVIILKCFCDREPVLGLVYGPETDGAYYRRPAVFLVTHTKFHCPTCKKRPKEAAWFTSAGHVGRDYEMLTLQCRFCSKSSSILIWIQELHKDPVPDVTSDKDLPPLAAAAAGPITVDYLLEFDRQFSEENLLQALQALPRGEDWEIKKLPSQTETRPEKKP